MPVGKGSLQRAASAAGKNTKAKTAPKKVTEMDAAKAETVPKPYLLRVPAEYLAEIPAAWNAGNPNRTNIAALAESISRCGILEPIPVVQTGEHQYQMVGGRKRMQAVQRLGIAEVPVLVLSGCTLEEAEKLYLELNPEAVKMQRKQERPLSLFGKQRIPEYLL